LFYKVTITNRISKVYVQLQKEIYDTIY